MDINEILLIFAILLLTAVFSSKISGRLGIPALILFILVGILAGSDGIGGIYFDNFEIAHDVGIVALTYILFMGGLSVDIDEIKPVIKKGIVLSTLGVLVNAFITGLLANYLLHFPLLECFLLGAIVSATDVAAVFGILRAKHIALKGDIRPILEFESGSNDPMAVFLTVSIISLITGKITSPYSLGFSFLQQMILGVLLGYLIAKLGVIIINRIKLDYEGLYVVITIAIAALAYSFPSMVGGNGFMSIYVCGLTMASSSFAYKKILTRFHDGIAWMMQIIMFLILGLLVFVKESYKVALPAFFIALVLIFVARPIAVFTSLAFTKSSFREKLFISWVGLRGAVPIVLATFPLSAGLTHSHDLFDIVFFLVVISVILQGTTISVVAKLLKVDIPFEKHKKHHTS